MGAKLERLKKSLIATLTKAIEKERERYKDGMANDYLEIEEFAQDLIDVITINRHEAYKQQEDLIRKRIYKEQEEERKKNRLKKKGWGYK